MRIAQTRWGVWGARAAVLLSLQGCGGGSTEAPLQLAPETRRALVSRPTELRLAQGRLRVLSLYKAQALILADPAPLTRRERIDRLVQEVYRPHAAFWKGYAGDERDFRSMARRFFASDSPLPRTLPQLAVVNLDSLFEATAAWLRSETGLDPEGTWYLVYGPGVTNMGGLGSLGMVADFTLQGVEQARLAAVLSHELAHQVHNARTADPDSGTVLERVMTEGLATYSQYVFHGGAVAPARVLGYSDAEFAWALAHEGELQAAANAILSSRQRDHTNRVASRRDRLVGDGPRAAGYFLGFRVVEAYVARHGRERWAELFGLPVREAVRASGYALKVEG